MVLSPRNRVFTAQLCCDGQGAGHARGSAEPQQRGGGCRGEAGNKRQERGLGVKNGEQQKEALLSLKLGG